MCFTSTKFMKKHLQNSAFPIFFFVLPPRDWNCEGSSLRKKEWCSNEALLLGFKTIDSICFFCYILFVKNGRTLQTELTFGRKHTDIGRKNKKWWSLHWLCQFSVTLGKCFKFQFRNEVLMKAQFCTTKQKTSKTYKPLWTTTLRQITGH